MIQKREMMKREQLMVQQEIFLQQHWDLTDTTGESRPLGIEPGKYKARPRQPPPAPAAPTLAAAAAAGGAVGAGGIPGAALPAAPVQVWGRKWACPKGRIGGGIGRKAHGSGVGVCKK